MASSLLEKNSVLQDRILKSNVLPIRIKMVGNATPASKVASSDLPGVVLFVAAGQSAAPSGVTTVTPVDATGKFSIVLDSAEMGSISKVHKVDVIDVTSTQSVAASLSNGYIVIDVDSAADLTSASCEFELLVYYTKK